MRFITTPFFKTIRDLFGIPTCSLLKKFIKYSNLSVRLRIRIHFVKTCINLELIPPHLYITRHNNLRLFHNTSIKRLRTITKTHTENLLRLEMRDAYTQLEHITREIYKLITKINYALPIHFANAFFGFQEKIQIVYFARK